MKNKSNKKHLIHLNEEEIASLLCSMASFSASMSYWLTIGSKAGEEAVNADTLRVEADNITDSIKNIFSKTEDVQVMTRANEACEMMWEAAALAVAVIESEIEEDDLDEDESE